MDREIIKRNVQAVVHQVMKKFQMLPFNYMSECDIQAELFVRLRDQLNWQIEFSHDSVNSQAKELKFRAALDLINTEYNEKFDIVCLDPYNTIGQIRENKNKQLSDFLWRLPILVGIEIKLVRYVDRTKGISICTDDVEKLTKFFESQKQENDLEANWFMLCFFQNTDGLKKMRKDNALNDRIKEDLENKFPEYNQIYLIAPDRIVKVE